jgi:hypothetical protein
VVDRRKPGGGVMPVRATAQHRADDEMIPCEIVSRILDGEDQRRLFV